MRQALLRSAQMSASESGVEKFNAVSSDDLNHGQNEPDLESFNSAQTPPQDSQSPSPEPQIQDKSNEHLSKDHSSNISDNTHSETNSAENELPSPSNNSNPPETVPTTDTLSNADSSVQNQSSDHASNVSDEPSHPKTPTSDKVEAHSTSEHHQNDKHSLSGNSSCEKDPSKPDGSVEVTHSELDSSNPEHTSQTESPNAPSHVTSQSSSSRTSHSPQPKKSGRSIDPSPRFEGFASDNSFSFSGQEYYMQNMDSEGEQLEGWTPLELNEIASTRRSMELSIEMNSVVEFVSEPHSPKLASTQPIPKAELPVSVMKPTRLGTTQVIRPRTGNAGNGPYRWSRGISIDNYDPSNRRPFTDPLTKEAIRNLGIKLNELFYPTDRELAAYTREKDMREVVRERLRQRVQRTQEAVRAERDRIAYKPPSPFAATKGSDVLERSLAARGIPDHSRERMEKARTMNKREAEQILLSLLVEKEMREETRDQQEKEKQERLKLAKEERLRKKKIREEQLQRIKDLETKEIERRKEIDQKRQKAEEQEKIFQKRREETEKLQRQYYEQLEAERARKNAEARKIVEQLEEKRKQHSFEVFQQQLLKEKEWKQQQSQKMKEREERARAEEKKSEEKMAAVRAKQKHMQEDKRARTQEKQEKQEASAQQIRAMKLQAIEQMKVANEEKQKARKASREKLQAAAEEQKKSRFEAQEKKSIEYYKNSQEEQNKQRRLQALQHRITMEERRENAHRIYKRLETDRIDAEKQYEERMKLLNDMEQNKVRQQRQLQFEKSQLERDTYTLKHGMLSIGEVRTKGIGHLRRLADRLGIDFSALEEKAKELRNKGKGVRSSLPPMRPANLL